MVAPVKPLVFGGYRFCKGDLFSAGARLTTTQNRGPEVTRSLESSGAEGPRTAARWVGVVSIAG